MPCSVSPDSLLLDIKKEPIIRDSGAAPSSTAFIGGFIVESKTSYTELLEMRVGFK